MNWMLDAGFYNMGRMGELEDMEEAMQANTGAKDEAIIYIRGENIVLVVTRNGREEAAGNERRTT